MGFIVSTNPNHSKIPCFISSLTSLAVSEFPQEMRNLMIHSGRIQCFYLSLLIPCVWRWHLCVISWDLFLWNSTDSSLTSNGAMSIDPSVDGHDSRLEQEGGAGRLGR